MIIPSVVHEPSRAYFMIGLGPVCRILGSARLAREKIEGSSQARDVESSLKYQLVAQFTRSMFHEKYLFANRRIIQILPYFLDKLAHIEPANGLEPVRLMATLIISI